MTHPTSWLEGTGVFMLLKTTVLPQCHVILRALALATMKHAYVSGHEGGGAQQGRSLGLNW